MLFFAIILFSILFSYFYCKFFFTFELLKIMLVLSSLKSRGIEVLFCFKKVSEAPCIHWRRWKYLLSVTVLKWMHRASETFEVIRQMPRGFPLHTPSQVAHQPPLLIGCHTNRLFCHFISLHLFSEGFWYCYLGIFTFFTSLLCILLLCAIG